MSDKQKSYREIIDKLMDIKSNESRLIEMKEFKEDISDLLGKFRGRNIKSITFVDGSYLEDEEKISFTKMTEAYDYTVAGRYELNLDVSLSDTIVSEIERCIASQEKMADTEVVDDESLGKIKEILGV